jgi:DNA-binding XRE family transcriptional regulator
MYTPKQKQIMSCVKKLLNGADKKFLSSMSTRKKLVLALRNELLFMGAFTQADLDNHVVPFLHEQSDKIYAEKEKVLKGEKLAEHDDYVVLIKQIGQTIQNERKKKRYTQRDLAARAKTTQQMLSRIESGRDLKQPTLGTYHKIFTVLGLKLKISHV